MTVKASAKMIRISPQKVRLVTRLLPGKDVSVADQELRFLEKGAATPVLTLLRSAVANAENNFEMTKNNLVIKEVLVGEGPTYKRWRARSRGMAAQIAKRTSHITIVLAEKYPGKGKDKKKSTSKKSSAPEVVKLKSRDEIKKLSKDDSKKKTDKDAGKQQTGYFQKSGGKDGQVGAKGKGVKGFVDKVFRRKSGE